MRQQTDQEHLWKIKGQIEYMKEYGETDCKIKLKMLEQIIDMALEGLKDDKH